MRPISLSFSPADDDTNGYGATLSGTAGAAFTLTANNAGDSMAHLVIITPSGSVTGNYTLTGTDADGHAQTETLATSTTNAVTSTKYYKTLTEVLAPSGIGAETVDIGWTDDIVSKTIPLDSRANPFSVGIGVDITGTINYTIQHTFASILAPGSIPSTEKWFNHSSLTGQTADANGNYAFNCQAMRLLINSMSSGATVTLEVVQAPTT